MNYLIRRCLISLGLIYVVTTLLFLALHIVPGDPAELLLSGGGVAPAPETVAELRDRLGLNDPLWKQYIDHLVRLAHGDLGTSFQDDHPVVEEVVRRLPRTLELILAAAVLALAIGLPLGALAAVRRGRATDRILSGFASFNLSVPVFVTGTILVLVFAQKLRWVPAGGYTPLATDPLQHLVFLLMPAFAISVGLAAVVFRMARAAVLDTLERDWVRTARAKGLSPRRVVVRHVVRNALTPVVTVLGLHMGSLLGGTVLVEYVFNWPGVSSLLVRAVEQRDYPEVLGVVLVVSFLFILLNLVVDLLYALLDPRVRHA
ncbi:MAG: ABC transporter permease [Alphaproteobacteria bacterium]|nr:ABC transporter permease [Alphaproteobacteria bacterium]